jgi:large subunit ribosomal protein L4
VHADRKSVFAFDPADFEGPSTKRAADLISDRRGGSVLVVLGAEESDAAKSFRNLAGVSVIPTSACGVADIVGHATLVLSEVALASLTERAKKPVSREGLDDVLADSQPPSSAGTSEVSA